MSLGIIGLLGHTLRATSGQNPRAPKAEVSKKTLPSARRVVTFDNDIAPILSQHCTYCHRPGEVASTPLVSYEDVKPLAALIATVVADRSMPPWKPVAGYGKFLNARRLTDTQIQIIKEWAETGAPKGKSSSKDHTPAATPKEEWPLGTPDLVATMSKPFAVPAQGRDLYRCFVLPSGLTDDKYFVAFDLRPSNRRVVHHAIVMQAISGAGRRLESAPGDGYPCFGAFGVLPSGAVGLWLPGAVPSAEPDGVARLLKKGSDLILQIHFHLDGQEEQEQVSVGIYFARKPPEKIPVDVTLGNIAIDIPVGKTNYEIDDSYTLPIDSELIGIIPHCHLLCREIKATAILPDGSVKPLLWIKDWDFNWQQWYRYSSPVRLPRGTRVDAIWRYDNSAANAHNPNHPPQRVTWGEQSTDEMAELKLELSAERQSEKWQLLHNELEMQGR